MLFCIEGIDGSGKKTQCAMLKQRIDETFSGRLSTLVYDFPHPSSTSGPYIKGLLKGEWNVTDPGTRAIVLQALQTINRYEALDTIKSAQHWPDDILILDRYYASALAYGAADGLDMQFLYAIHRGLPIPDITVLIDLPPEASMQRRPIREDLYESDVAFLAQVRANYLELFADRARLLGKVKIIDGTMDAQAIHEQIFITFEEQVRWDIIL